jgi:hypothetical protein
MLSKKIPPLLLGRRTRREPVRVEMKIRSDRPNKSLELQCRLKTAANNNLTNSKRERSADNRGQGCEEDLHETNENGLSNIGRLARNRCAIALRAWESASIGLNG